MASAAAVSVTMGVMKPVLDKLSTLMGDEYKKIKGLRKEVSFLRDELRAMDALLEKMDAADRLDLQAKEWRRDIIDMSYDIEDCIDDFMHRVGEPSSKVGILQKASDFLRTIKHRYRIANQIQKIKTRVIQTSQRRERYKLDLCISSTTQVIVDPRLSALYKNSTTLVGIDAQKEKLVKWAMDEEQELKVASIVGFGGLGKTTLANEVYREVGGLFDCKAFVSVSQTPDMTRLLNSLLLQLGQPSYPHVSEMDLINQISKCLQDKRYIIIIDDLWDSKPWKAIICAFPQNKHRSRVMITTRHENVARSCCGIHGFIHNMKPLSELDSRKLFFSIIFGPKDDCPSQLIEISSEILKKCGGLPLAIITIAGILASHPTKQKEAWEYIQKELANESTTNSNYEDMMYILDLSYKHLPRHLKACFLYLGSYPEDHEINREELVRRWVAEGFVSSSSVQDVWDVAESYFNELANRSMIQPTYREYMWGVYGWRVHDMLLELIARRCKEDNFLCLVNNDPDVVAKMQDKVIRRLTVVGFGRSAKDEEVARTSVRNLSRIRSLTMLGVSNWMPPLVEFKFVRVLSLKLGSMAMDLTDINQLSQLRYLEVEGYNQNIVIKGLRVLEILDLHGMISICSIEIVDAPRLSHLVVPHGTRLPDWIGRFKLLRTLRGFILPMDSMDGIIGLGELTALSDLQLYSPKWCAPLVEATPTWMVALGASLEKLCKLRQLVVYSHLYSDRHVVAWRADAVSLLSPPFHNLEMFWLPGWTFSRVPRWIGHLQNLRKLWIQAKQILQEDVAMIGTRLPSLLRLGLHISGSPTGSITIGGFPAVEWFEFDCDRMSYLRFEAGAMPQLRELVLSFDVDEWDKAAPGGLQHLASLEKTEVWKATYCFAPIHGDKDDLIRGVFQEAADALPTRPSFTLVLAGHRLRCIDQDYLEQQQLLEPGGEQQAAD